MTKFIKATLASLMALTTFTLAGGDIAPIEPSQATQIKIATPFYIGATYSYEDVSKFNASTYDFTKESALTVIGGYEFNKFFGAEGRLTTNFTALDTIGYGLYLKPQYPVTSSLKVYGLLGYAGSTYNGSNVTSGFGYGVGLSYDVTPKVFVFTDYTTLYDNGANLDIGTGNVGVAYRF